MPRDQAESPIWVPRERPAVDCATDEECTPYKSNAVIVYILAADVIVLGVAGLYILSKIF